LVFAATLKIFATDFTDEHRLTAEKSAFICVNLRQSFFGVVDKVKTLDADFAD
jgi:hypothetical protein